MPASIKRQETAVDRASKILSIVRVAAERGEPCPSNAKLAERFDVTRPTIIGAFNFLEANGVIAVRRTSNSRVVEVIATGKVTAEPIREVTLRGW